MAVKPPAPGGDGSAPRSAPPVWLVDGDDPALVSEAVAAVIEDLVGGAERSLVVEDIDDEEASVGAVVDACQTPPFLAERRVVVVRGAGRFGTEELAPLLSYLEDPLPTTALVLVGGSGKIASKLVAAVKALGEYRLVQVAPKDAAEWVRQRVAGSGLRLDAAALQMLVGHLGGDLSRLGSILAVLVAAFGPGAHLGSQDVEPYLGAAGSVTPWELTDAIDAGRNDEALKLLHRMLEAGDRHPLVVLATLQRHIQMMLRVDGSGITTEAEAAAALGIAKGRSTYPAKKALASARRLGRSRVGEAVLLVAQAELALKGALDWPAEMVLELLVARLCQLSRSASPRRRPR